MITKTMPSETVEAGRIVELVRQIEVSELGRDGHRRRMNGAPLYSDAYKINQECAEILDARADTARAELRAILGVDPYRLANAIGA